MQLQRREGSHLRRTLPRSAGALFSLLVQTEVMQRSRLRSARALTRDPDPNILRARDGVAREDASRSAAEIKQKIVEAGSFPELSATSHGPYLPKKAMRGG